MKPRDQMDLLQSIDPAAGAASAADAIKAAAAHAEQHSPNWQARALGLLREYAATHPTITSEDVRVWAHATADLPMPPDQRAWGAVFKAALAAGMLSRLGFAPAASKHCHSRASNVWRSNVYRVENVARMAKAV